MKGQCGFVYDWGKKKKRPKNTCIGLVYLQDYKNWNTLMCPMIPNFIFCTTTKCDRNNYKQ